MDTSVDEVVFLRPLVFPLSQDVESGIVRRTGAPKHDLLDLTVLDLMARTSLIPRVIAFGHKLVKNRNAWMTSRHTQRIMKSLASAHPPWLSSYPLKNQSISKSPRVNHTGLLGGVA